MNTADSYPDLPLPGTYTDVSLPWSQPLLVIPLTLLQLTLVPARSSLANLEDSANQVANSSPLAVGDNTVSVIAGPYPTRWKPVASDLWSRPLMASGDLDTVDAALLAFSVDYAMKYYIVADLDIPDRENLSDTDLAWAILLKTKDEVRSTILRNGADIMDFGENIMFCVTNSIPKIRKRCSITFKQAIHELINQATFAGFLMKESRSQSFREALADAFHWAYGRLPVTVVNDWPHQSASTRPSISIRQWVFEFN